MWCAHCHCADCRRLLHLYLGTLEHPEEMRPGLEVFCRERLPWLNLSVDGPSFDGLPDPEAG